MKPGARERRRDGVKLEPVVGPACKYSRVTEAHADLGPQVRLGTTAGRGVLLATTLGSGVAFLDSTVVNVALPAIGADLEADVAGLQWTITGYALTLAALILLGGSLGDRYGRL